jgi:diguanylate cyclase
MQQGRFTLRDIIASKPFALTPRVKALLWAVLISVMIGGFQIGEPLDDVLAGARNYVRQQEYKGNVVVVGIDDKTAAAFGGYQYSKKIDAEVIDRLFDLGAKRVFIDKNYPIDADSESNAIFEKILKRHKGRIFLTTKLSMDPSTGNAKEIIYNRQYAGLTELVSSNAYISPFQLSLKLPISNEVQDRRISSFSAKLSNSMQVSNEPYKPDFSILAKTVPTVSFIDVHKGNNTNVDFYAKDVVIGGTSSAYGDVQLIPSQRFINRIYCHIIGAETLNTAAPNNWGWMPAWIIALSTSLIILFVSNYRLALGAAVIVFLSSFIIPIFLDAASINVDVIAGIVLTVFSGIRSFLIRKAEWDSSINNVSELPNFNAMRRLAPYQKANLVALKIRNYTAIIAGFGAEMESAIISEVVRRIAIGKDDQTIFHDGDTLMWFTDTNDQMILKHHLHGLSQISSATMHLNNQAFDLLYSFGVDTQQGSSIGARIGSAMLCAQEAAQDNQICKFYDPDRRDAAAWDLSLLDSMNNAIDNGEMWVAYQSKIDVKTGRIIGAEALARWSHPTRGMVGPEQFIDVAERNNRIDRLTEFVLDQAIKTAAYINKDFGRFSIAVNLSVQLLHHPDLLPMISKALVRHGLQANLLTLEITETGKLDQTKETIDILNRIVNEGITLSLDDYGTGNATLEYLKQMPFTEIKIDRSFVSNISALHDDLVMVQSTIAMAHSLSCKVVAEGVESQETLSILGKLGCDLAQGFYIGMPIRQNDFIKNIVKQDIKKIA